MSLTSSLYAGTSGLSNTGNALQVTSNNIANINTLGFKKGTATFADTLYQTMGTNAGTSQIGLGMNVDNVAQVFTDGSLETTSNATDLAIGGDGFFVVSESGSDEKFYTRAGNFSLNEVGALVSSEGYIVQGWNVDGDTGEVYGAVTDLILNAFTSPPDDTDEITVITNLDADAESKSVVLSNLFRYNEEEGTTVDSGGYEYQTVVTAYDSLGASHEVTIYYDKKSDTEWEYIIACDRDEDKRALVANTDAAGLLARGNISFSESSGDVVSMTMEELTGVIGNVQVTGNNTIDDVHFEIENSEVIQADGYGFSLYYNGDVWNTVNTTENPLPGEYSAAKILFGNATTIHIDLDGTGDTDLKISLDEYATADSTLTFDINNPSELHIQDLENVVYTEDAYNNTTLSINDPGVMTTSVEDIGIVWNPNTETWSWRSDPERADALGTLINIDEAGVSHSVTNAGAMTALCDDVSVRWDGASWDWNEALKDADINFTSSGGGVIDTSPDIRVIGSGSEGAALLAGAYELTWDASGIGSWTVSKNPAGLTCAVTGTADGCVLTVDSGNPSIIEISLDPANTGNGTIEFTIDSTPPEEYANAKITISDASGFTINMDGSDANGDGLDDPEDDDLSITGLTGLSTFSFDVDPCPPPSEYSSATLSGDATYCSIDLDGSGNEDDSDDIVFTFEEELSGPVASTITFDISGSRAWRTVTADEVEEAGYYQFTADFLGGEFGATESDISFNIGSKFNGSNWINDSLSSTQYATSSSTTYQDSDGYAAGDLTGIEVEPNGLVSGSYSNGQQIALFMVALADFNNVNGLKSMGGNLYLATTESGAAITNQPGENGLGTLSSYALEMSNVDISEEFVDMIGLQTAYEANAKIITTVDEMMNTVIGMKR